MNFTLFANEFIFPSLLFCFFYYAMPFSSKIDAIKTKDIKTARQTVTTNILEDFYELIDDNDKLRSQLDTISDRQQLTDKLIKMAASYGYYFTALDIDRSVEEHTETSQANYICLPIGCWRIS